MKTDYLTAADGEALREASLFKRVRALTRAMRKAQWRFVNEAIRHKMHCPLSFVAKIGNARDGAEAGAALGFDYTSISGIMWAADRQQCGLKSIRKQHGKYRRILLRAAGLKERQ